MKVRDEDLIPKKHLLSSIEAYTDLGGYVCLTEWSSGEGFNLFFCPSKEGSVKWLDLEYDEFLALSRCIEEYHRGEHERINNA